MISDTLRNLLTDPITYVLLVALVAGVRFYLKRRIAAGVDHQFAVRLEDHKQSLRLAADAARYQYEQRLSQANLYYTNAHAAAVELYRVCRIAHGMCVNLRGRRQALTFEEFNRADLAAYMASHEVPLGKQEEILARLAVDRPGAIRDMRAYLKMVEFQEAERKLGEARNTASLNELYFDDAVIGTLNQFFTVMATWMSYVESPPERDERTDVPSEDQMRQALQAVHTALRDRLRGAEGGAV